MADTFELEVATPERLLVQARATEAQIPAENGMLGVLPDHAAFLSMLGTGELSYSGAEGRRRIFISGGWVQILNNHVRVLADRAENVQEIDIQRAQAALQRARERLILPPSASIDVARALRAARRAEARLAAAGIPARGP
jgi:F-type H+-transporting ATPase subunit epsilon